MCPSFFFRLQEKSSAQLSCARSPTAINPRPHTPLVKSTTACAQKLAQFTSSAFANVTFVTNGINRRFSRQSLPLRLNDLADSRAPVSRQRQTCPFSSFCDENRGAITSLIREVLMNTELLMLGQVAKLVGVPYWRITYAHASGKVREPELRVGNRRLYTTEDVERLMEHFHQTSTTSSEKAP